MVFSFHSFSVRLCSTRKYPYTPLPPPPPPPPRPCSVLLPSTESNGNSEEKEGGQKEAIFEGVGVVSRGIFFRGLQIRLPGYICFVGQATIYFIVNGVLKQKLRFHQ